MAEPPTEAGEEREEESGIIVKQEQEEDCLDFTEEPMPDQPPPLEDALVKVEQQAEPREAEELAIKPKEDLLPADAEPAEQPVAIVLSDILSDMELESSPTAVRPTTTAVTSPEEGEASDPSTDGPLPNAYKKIASTPV